MDLARKATDKIAGRSYVDNSADPTSALSMLRRKAMNKSMGTPKQSVGRGSSGVGVGM